MLGISIIKKILVSFRSYCHDSNAFPFLALQRFKVNRFVFRWTRLATIFLFFQCFTFQSGIISFKQGNFIVLDAMN